MAKKEWASLVAGLVLATAGVTALAFAGGRPAEASLPVPAPAASVPAEGTSGGDSAAPAAQVPPGGTGGAAAGTGAEAGSLREIDPAAFGIPPEVARVLASRGVILTVRQTGDTAISAEGGAR